MMFALRSREAVREGRNQLFVDRNIFPQTLDVLLTRSEPFGIELIVDELRRLRVHGQASSARSSSTRPPTAPCATTTDFAAAAHSQGRAGRRPWPTCSALALLKAPGEWGADIAVGSTQRLGTPDGLRRPRTQATWPRSEAYKRNMPGRIIGVSVDRLGNKALRMALQMREQHIKRERATSNICTASALMASMAGFYCVYNGPEGLNRAADTAHTGRRNGRRRTPGDGLQTRRPQTSSTRSKSRPKPPSCSRWHSKAASTSTTPPKARVRMSFDEVTTPEEVGEVIRHLRRRQRQESPRQLKPVTESRVPAALRRRTAYLSEAVFHTLPHAKAT